MKNVLCFISVEQELNKLRITVVNKVWKKQHKEKYLCFGFFIQIFSIDKNTFG